MVAGACGDHGNSAPEPVEGEWSSPTESVLTLCLRMEESTVRARGFNTSPATLSPVIMKVRICTTQLDAIKT